MTRKNTDLIQFLSVSNLVPILMTIITVVIFVVGLGARIDLLNQKMDYVIEAQKEILGRYAHLEERYGDLALRIREVETRLSISK